MVGGVRWNGGFVKGPKGDGPGQVWVAPGGGS